MIFYLVSIDYVVLKVFTSIPYCYYFRNLNKIVFCLPTFSLYSLALALIYKKHNEFFTIFADCVCKLAFSLHIILETNWKTGLWAFYYNYY